MKQVQSYVSVMLRGKFSVYQMRIFLHIVKRAQTIINVKSHGDYSILINQSYKTDCGNVKIAFPIKEILGKNTHNYEPVKSEIRQMAKNWIVEYYDADNRIWHVTPVIYNIEIEEQSGMVRLQTAEWIIDYICNFKKFGYRIYDYDTALELRNPFASKLYLLTCSQQGKLVFEIENFKKWLGVSGVYHRAYDLARRVLEPAKKELADKNVNGFDYRLLGDRPGKTAKITKIAIIPVKRETDKKEEEINIGEQMKAIEDYMPQTFSNYLAYNLQFTIREIYGNRATIQQFLMIDNWQTKFINITNRARQKTRGHGYIINAMKKEIIAAHSTQRL